MRSGLALTSQNTQNRSKDSQSNLHAPILPASCPLSDLPPCCVAPSSLLQPPHWPLCHPWSRVELSCLILHWLLSCLTLPPPKCVVSLSSARPQNCSRFLVGAHLDFWSQIAAPHPTHAPCTGATHTLPSHTPLLLYLNPYLWPTPHIVFYFFLIFIRFLPYLTISSVKTGIFVCSTPLLNPWAVSGT